MSFPCRRHRARRPPRRSRCSAWRTPEYARHRTNRRPDSRARLLRLIHPPDKGLRRRFRRRAPSGCRAPDTARARTSSAARRWRLRAPSLRPFRVRCPYPTRRRKIAATGRWWRGHSAHARGWRQCRTARGCPDGYGAPPAAPRARRRPERAGMNLHRASPSAALPRVRRRCREPAPFGRLFLPVSFGTAGFPPAGGWLRWKAWRILLVGVNRFGTVRGIPS